jgi:gluconokinase
MIVVVMGVSGSGKTAVGMALALRLGWAFEDADDRHPRANVEKMRGGAPLTDEDRRPWLRELGDVIRAWSDRGRDVVLACSALRKWHRDALRSGAPDGGSIRFVYLEGTHELIDQRLRHRVGHFMPPSLLESQLATLEKPDATEALVVDVGPPVAVIVDAIVTGLRLDARPEVMAPPR